MFTFFATWVLLEVIVIAGEKLGILLWVSSLLVFFIAFAGLSVGFIQISLAVVDGKSAQMTKNFEISIFLFIVDIALLNLIGASLPGIGLIVSVPTSALMKVFVFR